MLKIIILSEIILIRSLFLLSLVVFVMGSLLIQPIFAPSHPVYVGVDKPLKQIAQGIVPKNVTCNEGLTLIIKHNDSPACVRPDTAKILEERGWGIIPSSQSKNILIDIVPVPEQKE